MMELDQKLNIAPEAIRHIHIMGICGTAMAAMAGMLKASGYTVTGSDTGVYPPMSDFLEKSGIQAAEGYDPKNLTPRPDLVIVGNVITRKNPEAIGLAEAAIPYLSIPPGPGPFFYQLPHLPCGRRHPRQDHHILAAGLGALPGRP